MKLAVFSWSFPVLSETFVINQIIGLKKLGVEVDVYSNETVTECVNLESVEKNKLLDNYKCIGLNCREGKLRKIITFFQCFIHALLKGKLPQLNKIIFDRLLTIGQKINLIAALSKQNGCPEDYNNIIVHFGNNGYYVCKMRELGLISGPISTIFHGYEISVYSQLEKNNLQYKKLFESGELMLPISECWRKKLIELGCPLSKIKVHRMGIDTDAYDIQELTSSINTPLNLVQVGRLTEKKAVLDSIKAVVKANEKIAIKFNIIGDGELYKAAKELIDTNEASEYIFLLGKQKPERVKEFLDSSDVFVLPSVRASNGDMEGIPVALMEAMAKGLIVLSTNHSGIPELIEDQESGFLVDEASVEGLSNALVNISNLDQESLIRIRKNARDIVLSKYNDRVLNQNLVKYL
ncbi:glycosyltransferase [Vibrio parahaemolyticus]|uniref:glycosyltransferase n=2 Tax=Vibrio harveyi group TaxID=717610 RepID=UPI0027E4F85F|nr:glycosyltransferase [Vibrio parahaemolyticus]WMN63448.1 glycosyltransferase [Vibrio parahaemolyticus]WMN74084.1 glycosyltransferase [Vibrio parahaemolyticus]